MRICGDFAVDNSWFDDYKYTAILDYFLVVDIEIREMK